jgi:16S rRNA (guanine527-N7)-methyltransferase
MSDSLAAVCAARGVPQAAGPLAVVLEELAREPAAVTAIRDREDAIDRHVADALEGLRIPDLAGADSIADVGSGSGFPGLALAAALPNARVTLVESVARKTAFLQRAARAAGLDNVVVVTARAEEWREGLDTQAAVTARAVAPLAVLVEYAAPLLRPGGVLVAWKGVPEPSEEAAGSAAAAELSMEPEPPLRAEPFPGAGRRGLYVYRKVGPTPAGYPRRPGVARRRPLGGAPRRSSDRDRR